ncbi:hypothetical protein V6B33_13560 [Mangrovibacillus sp. Mu-81]
MFTFVNLVELIDNLAVPGIILADNCLFLAGNDVILAEITFILAD